MRSTAAALVFAGLAALLAISAARADVKALQGAWLQPGSSCKDVFIAKGKRLAFRQPADLFTPAFIVSGNRVQTPGASCRIGAAREKDGRIDLDLSCATQIAVDPVKVQLSPGGDGSLYRYSGDADKLGTRYESCSP